MKFYSILMTVALIALISVECNVKILMCYDCMWSSGSGSSDCLNIDTKSDKFLSECPIMDERPPRCYKQTIRNKEDNEIKELTRGCSYCKEEDCPKDKRDKVENSLGVVEENTCTSYRCNESHTLQPILITILLNIIAINVMYFYSSIN